ISRISSDQITENTGVAPKTTGTAMFGELSVPVFGERNRLPGLHSLLLSFQARYDKTETRGGIGTIDDVPILQGGIPIIREVSFEKTTPSISFRWEPIRTVGVRGTWSRNFDAPPVSATFEIDEREDLPVPALTALVRQDSFCTGCPATYRVLHRNVANRDLKPTEAEQYSLGITWTPRGVLNGWRGSVNYRNTLRVNDQIGSTLLAAYL